MHLRTGKDSDFEAVGRVHWRSRSAAYAHILTPETLGGGSAEALGEWWSERWKWDFMYQDLPPVKGHNVQMEDAAARSAFIPLKQVE